MATTYELICHPDTPTRVATGVQVNVRREAHARMALTYRIIGNRGVATGHSDGTVERCDGLWKDTCFEAFIMPGNGPDYVEFNFAPRWKWAAYQFDSKREGMRNLVVRDPLFDFGLVIADMHVLIDLTGVGSLNMDKPLKLGLSAVLKDKRNQISYWALTHPAGKPDFHDPACFAITLGAPSNP